MWNCNAVADRGRAKLFALHQHVENVALWTFADRGRLRRDLLQRLLLVVDFERRNDRLRRDKIGERHKTVRIYGNGRPRARHPRLSGRRTIWSSPTATSIA